MKKINFIQAVVEAMAEEMARDENVVLMGEDAVSLGGGLSNFMGLAQYFPDRVLNMPLSESAFSHFAAGAAVAGLRPVVDLMFSDFATVCADAIANVAPKLRYCSNGKIQVPIVFYAGNGGRLRSGCHHAQSIESWFANIPGLKIVAPCTAPDVKGLLKAAIRDNDPVLFLPPEEGIMKAMTGVEEDTPEGEHIIPLNKAGLIVKEGTDVTLVTLGGMRYESVRAAEELEKLGISVEVVDPRVLIPLDKEVIFNSVRKTGKLVIAHEAPTRGGFGGEIAAVVTEECFDALKAPVKRVGALNMPIPAGFAEQFVLPNAEKIVSAVKSLVEMEAADIEVEVTV